MVKLQVIVITVRKGLIIFLILNTFMSLMYIYLGEQLTSFENHDERLHYHRIIPINIYINKSLFNKNKKDSTIWTMLHNTKNYDLTFTTYAWKNLTSLASVSKFNQELCEDPKDIKVEVDKSPTSNLGALSKNINTDMGGRWRPSTCKAQQKVALLVPYRDRASMLGPWLRHIHTFLQKQNIDYTIYIAEQDSLYEFNRAMLLNIATKFAIRMEDCDCLINHDIDQLPEMLANKYTCDENTQHVTHYATYVACRSLQASKYHFGLVTSLTPAQFLSVNGYSNLYFGWGAEDEDMSVRLRKKRYKIKKRPSSIGRYQCLPHKKAPEANDRFQYKKTATKRSQKEGYNTLAYEVISYAETPLFTWIYVRIDKQLVRTDYQ